jgi:hypothetical protein
MRQFNREASFKSTSRLRSPEAASEERREIEVVQAPLAHTPAADETLRMNPSFATKPLRRARTSSSIAPEKQVSLFVAS